MIDLSLQTEIDMGNIKPSVNYKGYLRALNEYPEKSIPEELAANSYDAYASTFLLILDELQNKLYCIDDGDGFTKEGMEEMMTLGGGGKEYVRSGERVFLGSYGFGLKAVLKIADRIKLETCSLSDKVKYVADLDLKEFESKIKSQSEGYNFDDGTQLPNKESKGTIITLSLKKLTTKVELEEFAKGLGNLPTHNGSFNCYYGFLSETAEGLKGFFSTFVGLKDSAKKLLSESKINPAANLFDAELTESEVTELTDKDDHKVKAKFYFAGMDNGEPIPMKQTLRGIYVRVNGRLLKADFDTTKYTSKISKYIQFKSSMRTELSIDWLRTEISLSRDGVSFQNEKLEVEFMKVISSMINRFLKPKLEKKEKLRVKGEDLRHKQRMELANKRISKSADVVIKEGKSGFVFKPDTDAELAILIAQDYIMSKINPHYKLIDYDAQAPFDCMIYDSSRTDYIFTELEPSLVDFLEHKNKSKTQLIIVWTINKWRIGKAKKGKDGWFRLTHPDSSPKGNYKLLQLPSESSQKPKKHFQVIVVEELLK